MSAKSKRLIELMMLVNRKRKFTVKELAYEFNVSPRTILRDLQELSELGVPLYSEVGPHGGYQVLNERVLPPITFTEEEAVSLFFASHALRHFSTLPFEAESKSALKKFYAYLPSDVKNRIDEMKNRFDFIIPTKQAKSEFLSILLETAISQSVISIEYDSYKGRSKREIQPIGIYANNGLWYCPAYCFNSDDYRLFRCDKILSVCHDVENEPLNLPHISLGKKLASMKEERLIKFYVELSRDGVQRCETIIDPRFKVQVREDGTGFIEDWIGQNEIPFIAQLFISIGKEAKVKEPIQLLQSIREKLSEVMEWYEND
ncbi:transcriptional regulator [Bacillus sp. AFS002410]|uniref:helix-turn-helix transcriptional regulator n=1 Tax=Bacillus sp. AFS002410 TaxID=2033481 RepID=UPI000BEF458B|nr:YafY family protein [Bacillus sp. AFS002410]PEJ57487.1 transcriptional regulator [Bacillus sp. AFS002410]